MKKLRVLLLTLCVAVFMCGFTVTAHAGGGDEYMEPTDQWEGLDEPTPTIEPGEGFSDEGNLVTRGLLYDEHTKDPETLYAAHHMSLEDVIQAAQELFERKDS